MIRFALCFFVLLELVTAQRLSPEENNELVKNCGRISSSSGGSIYKVLNGQIANRSAEAPWVIGIANDCSGTLISPRHVMTAAHCIHSDAFLLCNARSGSKVPLGREFKVHIHDTCRSPVTCELNSIAGEMISYRVKKVYMPMNYINGKSCGNGTENMFVSDIAIMLLDADVQQSERLYPACLSVLSPEIGAKLDMYGYGADREF